MSDNVIQFTKARPVLEQTESRMVWTCNCGSQWFWLFQDQSVQCTQCDKNQSLKTFFPDERSV